MKKKDFIIGTLLIAIFVLLFTATMFLWVQDFSKFESGTTFGYKTTTRVSFVTSIYVLYIGLILFVGYFFESSNYFLRWLMKICNGGNNQKNWPTPFIGLMGTILGIVGIVKSFLGYYL